MKRWLLAILAVVTLLIVGAGSARAEGNTITISPAQADIELGTTDTEKRSTFTITNNYNVPVDLSVELKGIDQSAGLIVPTDDVDHSLADATHLSQTLITIPEQSSATVNLIISNTASLSPGGHYGTIVFTQRKSGQDDVNFTQAISTGLFVVKRGGQLRELESTSYSLRRLPFQLPSSSVISLKNIGNVHLLTRGAVLVYSQNNELVAKGIVNVDSRRLFPSKEQTEKVSITQSRKLWWPQLLRVRLEYRADGIEEAKFIEKRLLYIPGYVLPLVLSIVWLMYILVKRKMKHRRSRVKLDSFGEQSLVATVVGVHSAGPEVKPKSPSKKRRKAAKKDPTQTLEP